MTQMAITRAPCCGEKTNEWITGETKVADIITTVPALGGTTSMLGMCHGYRMTGGIQTSPNDIHGLGRETERTQK